MKEGNCSARARSVDLEMMAAAAAVDVDHVELENTDAGGKGEEKLVGARLCTRCLPVPTTATCRFGCLTS